MSTFNGKSMLLDKRHIQSVFTDSCTLAAGDIYCGDWFYINWDLDWPLVSKLHINSKEILAAYLAVCRWAPYWRNKRIYIQSDNVTAVAAINKGTSRNPFIMRCLRQLFWLSATYNFHVSARFLPGISNTVADDISRLQEPGRLLRILPYVNPSPPCLHVSHSSFSFLFPQIPRPDCPHCSARSGCIPSEVSNLCRVNFKDIQESTNSLSPVLLRTGYYASSHLISRFGSVYCVPGLKAMFLLGSAIPECCSPHAPRGGPSQSPG